nr:baculoviral IAP repeat-containing protein 3-like [Penaeus vannamei]
MNKEIQRLKTFDDDEDKYAYHPKVIAKAGFYKVENEFICFNCNLKLSAKDIDTGKNIVEIHQDRDASCTFAHNLPFLPRSRLYKDEEDTEESRRSTYYDKDNWPLKDQSFVEKLVEAGFYYTEDDDDPWIQHAMWNPNCSYIQLKMGEDWGDFVKKTMKIKENLYRTPAIKTRSNITEIDWNTLLGLISLKNYYYQTSRLGLLETPLNYRFC